MEKKEIKKSIILAKNGEYIPIIGIVPKVSLGEVITMKLGSKYGHVTGKVTSMLPTKDKNNARIQIEPKQGSKEYELVKKAIILYNQKTNTGHICVIKS